ncbi:MAG: hypothetical protein WCX17_03470 [Parcubacteria group bacterium]|jgi:hypothetical protein
MAEEKQKLKNNENLTLIGRFAVWADGVEIGIGKRIFGLILLVGMSGFLVYQQSASWEFFRVKKVAKAADSELPQFSPKKEIMTDSGLRCTAGNENENIAGDLSIDQFAIKKNIEKLINDKPMQSMVEAVAERDPSTASYLVAIAKKESNLGKFSPKDAEGKDCFNYWGFRGSQNTTKSGYSCFDSPEQAVAIVGDRIQFLSKINNYDTPKKMSVWKCGFDCSWDNPVAVKKWIADVGYYYKKINTQL